MQTYEQVLNNLQNTLNTPRSENLSEVFLNAVKDLKYNFGVNISTKFLKSLVIGSKAQKTQRVKYILKSSGIKTKEEIRYFKTDIYTTYKTEIIEYAHSKEPVYKHFPKYAFNEDMSLKAVVGYSENLEFHNIKTNGIKKRVSKLKGKKQRVRTGQEVLNLYNTINKDGGVYIKNSRTQEILNEGIKQDMEILRVLQI
jgi:hypothetical protein